MINLIPVIISTLLSNKNGDKPKVLNKIGTVTKNILKKRSVIAIIAIGIVVVINNYFQLGISYESIVSSIDKIILAMG